MKKIINRLIKIRRVILLIGIVLILFWGTRPILMHNPGKNENGYYITDPKTKEKIYLEEAKKLYWETYRADISLLAGCLLILSFIALNVKNKKAKA